MGRLRALALVLVVLAAGALIGSAVAQRLRSGADGGADGQRSDRERIRVEVLNAGGVPGAARAATAELRDGGFDVVFFGNADQFGRDSSIVLDRVDDVAAARDVADALGIRNVRSLPDSNLYLDVSVWLGADWAPEGAGAEGAESSRAWWDPRGWIRDR